MSSRLFSGGLGDAAPMEWRPAGGAATPGPARPSAPRRAGAHAHPEESIEARVQAAYDRGVAAGEATAEPRAAALAAPVLANFAAVVQELASARKTARQEAEDSMVKLALAIARRVLHREMATDPEAILGLVRSGIDRLSARELHVLRLAPGDARVVLEQRAHLGIPQAVELRADAGLPPGSAIFETTRGELDLSVQTQLDEIERGFADLVVTRRA